MKLQDELPVDHKLVTVWRIGAGLGGVFLIVFGCLGLADHPGFLSTHGSNVAGLSTNGALSILSIVAGAILVVGAVIGGNFAANLNMVVGVLFVLSGFYGLTVLGRPDANILNFRMANVLFAFLFGVVLTTFGMYGRVSSHLPHDNPYWRDRAAREEPLPSGPKTFVKIMRPGPSNPIGH
ncbi:DUF4383 domain-containing protein [Streptomyces sp. CB01881]|uniref:DUF4383 domain-containing protein n=1 Tax=Streptomyces sp. CB01881 TaxID=2078691 RepID=UPI000CDCA036|nr:DUF4383 domain-containing protein [Streptomyces sp. CB01881]AUY51832.1 DUF4383 domain-containing protein [Streptomyces sp. CB01881]TYC71260.1 DUF4383 domain-containing protein [Streptomyces sp. CB01881]